MSPSGSTHVARRTNAAPRLSGRATVILLAILAVVVIYATDQVAPASSDRQAQMRIWLAARATGVVTLLLLTFQICVGLVLSHPTNKSTWRLSKRIFPWHENLWVFVTAFLGVHIVSLLLDPYAGVGIAGTFIPGLSGYRSSPVALGTLAHKCPGEFAAGHRGYRSRTVASRLDRMTLRKLKPITRVVSAETISVTHSVTHRERSAPKRTGASDLPLDRIPEQAEPHLVAQGFPAQFTDHLPGGLWVGR